MGGCSVDITPKTIFVFTVHKSVPGFGVLDEPFFKVDRGSKAIEIGKTVLVSLSSSKQNLETTGQVKNFTAKVTAFTGYRSVRKFERDSINFSIRSDDSKVTIIPTNPRAKGGFLHDPSNSIICSMDPEEIGTALLRMLKEKKRQFGLPDDW